MAGTHPAELIDMLREHGVELEVGLSDPEVDKVQSTFGFRFPPDLRELLQYSLPVSPWFPNWRAEANESLSRGLAWPAHGICFDVENNNFWMDEWGRKPEELQAAFEVARLEISHAPVLIPIYGHRYIPDEPQLPGNPVFSVYQADIIYYGSDLAHYFANEFRPGKYTWTEQHERSVRQIRFWSRLVDLNNM